MDAWWDRLVEIARLVGTMPELIALVLLFVVNNALWMTYLTRVSQAIARVLWELVQQLTVLNREMQELQEMGRFQAELIERATSEPGAL